MPMTRFARRGRPEAGLTGIAVSPFLRFSVPPWWAVTSVPSVAYAESSRISETRSAVRSSSPS
jgi:hypothetical protein